MRSIMTNIRSLIAILALLTLLSGCAGRKYDVVVIGGGASGTAAAVASSRCGVRSLLVEEHEWLGGMLTSAGVSATDGNYHLKGGFWGEFRDSLEQRYGGSDALKTGWVSNILFEPSVGNAIFQNIADGEPLLERSFNTTLREAEYRNGLWHLLLDCGGELRRVESKILIDATELGDVAAMVGVKYDIGMESRELTREDIAPEESNDIVQDLTYVAVLKLYDSDQTIPQPEGYNAATYACCCQNARCIEPKEPNRMWSQQMMIGYGALPNGKFMINWPIEGNDYYLNLMELTPEERRRELEKAKNHTLGMLYFMQTELGMTHYGLADDEFPTEDRLPFIPYHRESRRIRGMVRFTLEHLMHPYNYTLYRTGIAVGDYPVDQHHMRYSGWEHLPDLHYHPIHPYTLPMAVMLPEEHDGLIVAEKSISVSNIVNGSSRLQPVVLQIGEAAGYLAALAVKGECEPKEVSVRAVQREILARRGYLLPFRDVDSKSEEFLPLQRVAAAGVLPVRGENVGWENLAWLDIERGISARELSQNLKRLYHHIELIDCEQDISSEELIRLVAECRGCSVGDVKSVAEELKIECRGEYRPTRLECALLIDRLLDPFSIEVDLMGEIVKQ